MEPEPKNQQESDEALMEKVALGVESAFAELYDRFAPPIYGLLMQMLRDDHDADDVLQEGFVSLWNRASGYDPQKGKAFTWAVTIFRNKAIDRIRAQGRRALMNERAAGESDLWSGERPADLDEVSDREERSVRVRQAMRGLPADQRRLIELAFLKGETQQSIADLLKLPLGTVKTNIRRGLLRLREAVGMREE